MTIVYDLRGALTTPPFWAPPEDPTEPATPPDASPDDDTTTPVVVAGEEDQEGDEPPANPELKKLHDEAARHRNRAKDAEAKATALTGQVRTLTLRLAFNGLANSANLTDLDAAWKLAADDLTVVDVSQHGTVDAERLGQIVAHVAERYPYLTAAPTPATPPTPNGFPATGHSGRPSSSRRPNLSGVNSAVLEAKFPALARRGRKR